MTEASDDRVERLLSTLSSLATLLQASGQDFWADWIDSARNRIARRDPYGLEHLLSAYGGMGSLTDLYLGDDTDQFDVLKQEAWAPADDLRSELRRP